jgi:hypothetical protein
MSTPVVNNYSARTKAYEVLADKNSVSQARVKTKMCQETMKGKKCYRKNCGFAHSKAELQVPACLFKNHCRTMHNSRNPCNYVHPCDTPASYKLRTGNPWPLDVIIPERKKPAPKPTDEYLRLFKESQSQMLEDEIRMLESIRLDEIKMEEERAYRRSHPDEEMTAQMTAQMSELNLNEEDDEEDDDEEDDDEEDDDEEDDEKRVVLLLTHEDKARWEARQLANGLQTPPHNPCVPLRNINVSLTPEQFAVFYPQFVRMGISFSSQ